MQQQRLNMMARTKSIVDKSYDQELASLESDIRQQSKAISDKVKELYSEKSEPQPKIVDVEDIEISDDRVRQVIQPMKDHLKLLKKKYEKKKALQPKVQQQAQKQSDMFEM